MVKVLFIGGTGTISAACSRQALERGLDLYLVNRGQSIRPVPEKARILRCDVRDRRELGEMLRGHMFDAVVDFIAFKPEDVMADVELFRGRTLQYVFISSCSAYKKPSPHLPITESTPLRNPFWEYSRAKIACEEFLLQAYRDEGFPVTIVRPSHTYDSAYIPIWGRYTTIDRMRRGGRVVVHGDGTSVWVLTHSSDFARGLVGLLGNPHAIGEAYHITSDELLTWDQIHMIMARAAGAEPNLVHITSQLIHAFDPGWGVTLLGDKAHSVIFDNSKIRRAVSDFRPAVPFARGAEEVVAWYDNHPAQQRIDAEFNGLLDRMISTYESAWPRPGA